MYVVVCYDITDNRRRARLYEELLGFGTPVQKSVFECQVTPKQLALMQSRIAGRYARKATDTIRFYLLCGQCRQRTMEKGTKLREVRSETEDYTVH